MGPAAFCTTIANVSQVKKTWQTGKADARRARRLAWPCSGKPTQQPAFRMPQAVLYRSHHAPSSLRWAISAKRQCEPLQCRTNGTALSERNPQTAEQSSSPRLMSTTAAVGRTDRSSATLLCCSTPHDVSASSAEYCVDVLRINGSSSMMRIERPARTPLRTLNDASVCRNGLKRAG